MDRKVIALGESVLDIIFKNGEPQAARPGGSSFNSIISVGRAGIPAVFISETGQDRVGAMIVGFLKENGVDTAYVIQYPGSKSALSLAFLNEKNDAEYEFYKDYPRQRLGNAFPELSANDILLFGSFYALNPVLRPKVRIFLEQARKSRTMVIYDPNFRSSHMDDLHQLRLVIEENFGYASVVRCSDEDLRNIYGATNIDEAWEKVAPFCNVLLYT
ncbi:MAG: PfkB family carbohydrate kinase, partial [Bacteroidota bacterium]